MKRGWAFGILIVSMAGLSACNKKTDTAAAGGTSEITDLAVLVAAVPTSGPRDGNNYKVFIKVLRQNQAPAENFPIDAWVKGKSEPKTLRTDKNGIVKFADLPFPDATHRLNSVIHYFKGKNDQEREIDYPYIQPDAYRLKDTQYIPNTVTPDPA